MQTPQTQAVISASGELTVQLPPSFPPGTPVMVLMIMATTPAPRKTAQPLKLGRHAAGLVRDDIYLGREVIYARDE
jgi:hypothetical protein